MNKIPKAHRSKEDQLLFERQTDDPTIQPDRVSAAVEGYFRLPAVWIDEEPDPASVSVLNPDVHHAVVVKRSLSCGIDVRVQRDGTFLFDFSSWLLAPQVVIPGYRIPQPHQPYRPPSQTSKAESDAEGYAILRSQVMNVHQACTATAEMEVAHSAGAMGFPVTSWNTHKGISFDTTLRYVDDTEDVRALARNVMNNKDGVRREQPLLRRVLKKAVIEYSLELLDNILSFQDPALIQLIELAYMAACRSIEKRFGEAMVLAWAVCEQLLSSAWDQLQEDNRTDGRMPSTRKQKLTGRDYTASVIVEVLELNGRLDHKLYQLLEGARKARNNWVHQMRVPEEHDVHRAIRAAEDLLWRVKGIRLSGNAGGRGGVPQWNIWIWNQVKGRPVS